MQAEPQKEHQWLQRLVGEWTFEVESTVEPGKPPETFKGTERVRSLGGLWVVCEARGEMPGGGFTETIMTLGYDPDKRRYVGTFVASMMAQLWIYDGTLDSAGRTLTLDTIGPSLTGGASSSTYQDIIEFESDELRLMSSQVLDDDGTWRRFTTVRYRRV